MELENNLNHDNDENEKITQIEFEKIKQESENHDYSVVLFPENNMEVVESLNDCNDNNNSNNNQEETDPLGLS